MSLNYIWRKGQKIFTDTGKPVRGIDVEFSVVGANLDDRPVPGYGVQLQGYIDGDLVIDGSPTSPAWDGTFPTQRGDVEEVSDGMYELFSQWDRASGTYYVDGATLNQATIRRKRPDEDVAMPWTIRIDASGNTWEGEMARTMNGPVGTYTRTGGNIADPSSLTVEKT